jgi:predicted XRE-type DNA-binding protein
VNLRVVVDEREVLAFRSRAHQSALPFVCRGLPNPDQALLKANLTLQIFRAIKARKLTQAKAGKILGIPQPHVSDLMRGRARAFSAERLMQFLTALGHDVEIRVKQTRKGHGHVSVVAA